MKKNKSFIKSLVNALLGIRAVSAKERNFRFHIFASIAVVILCIVARVETIHFLFVALAIFFVIATELINSAIEAVVDLITNGRPHPLAKFAKDAAAGAVLVAAFFAIIVGAVVASSVIARFL